MGPSTATIVGGGVAGLSAACALAEAGWRVHLIERRNYLGGRASSVFHPGVGETIDNSQHVIFGCCTNIRGFYERIGAADKIYWTDEMTMIEPGGRRSKLGPSPLPAPLHSLPCFLGAHAFSLKDKLALARAFQALMRPVPPDSSETLGVWLKRHKQTSGALNRFWRLVIASALNAEIETISLPYAAKVIRELFLASAEAGRMGMSRVPLSELYAGAAKFIRSRGGEISFNTRFESATWDEAAKKWSVRTTRSGSAVPAIGASSPADGTGTAVGDSGSEDGAGVSSTDASPTSGARGSADGAGAPIGEVRPAAAASPSVVRTSLGVTAGGSAESASRPELSDVLVSDVLILAVPFEATAKMLPSLPPTPGVTKLAGQLKQHVHWPICSVHLWFEKEITSLPHAVLLDREIHWLYNKTHIQPHRRAGGIPSVARSGISNTASVPAPFEQAESAVPAEGQYVELVVSASRKFAALSQAEAIALSVRELAEFFPAVNKTRLLKSALIKEQFATFGVPPGIDQARPTSISPWKNCFLAGDWIATGWPSTMESAARSGHLAAEAATAAVSAAKQFLVPDLKPRGLMRFIV